MTIFASFVALETIYAYGALFTLYRCVYCDVHKVLGRRVIIVLLIFWCYSPIGLYCQYFFVFICSPYLLTDKHYELSMAGSQNNSSFLSVTYRTLWNTIGMPTNCRVFILQVWGFIYEPYHTLVLTEKLTLWSDLGNITWCLSSRVQTPWQTCRSYYKEVTECDILSWEQFTDLSIPCLCVRT